MGILKPATNRSAYLKAGLLGFGGSGKSTTAALLLIALSKLYGRHKAVAMLDTETGSDYLIPLFEENGIALYPVKSRTFTDLLQVLAEGQGTETPVDGVLIDSVTHVWTELKRDYERAKKRTSLDFRDWDPIKREWSRFTDAYLNAPFHAIICGRAGFDYDIEVDDDGKKELVKTGVKMKAEGEMGYEPSLLIEMLRVPRADRVTADAATHGWSHRAVVLKDRSNQLNGLSADFEGRPGEALSFDPVLKFVAPHLKRLNIGGDHLGVDTSRTSEELFTDERQSRTHRARQVQITLELIKDCFIEADVSPQSNVGKKVMVEQLKACFGTSSWTAIEAMRLEDLEAGRALLRVALGLANGDPKVLEANEPAATVSTTNGTAPAAPLAAPLAAPVAASAEEEQQ